MKLREYQQEALDNLYSWWMNHPEINEFPLLEMPTGSGKSIVIAELVRLLFDTWPDEHPRTIVIVPSKELAEQNAEKLRALLPSHLSVGYYSASLGKKTPHADVIVATIGSIVKSAHVLGNIKCVVIDEAHLVSPDGAGRYRDFLDSLAKYCMFRVVGLTATPFRGNGVWLTSGKAPLFTGIAYRVSIQRLLDSGHLSPLIRPIDDIQTRIDTSDIKTSNGDYDIDALSDRVSDYIEAAAVEAASLAKDRKKWIAFTPTVINAQRLVNELALLNIDAAIVCGSTPKVEREQLIKQFKAGEIRCLVTVLALATGFDVPDVDCILWLRPTKSPVLYVQGSGRGLRIAEGKTDCLWLDFSDTTERLGPVDAIKGRKKSGDRDSIAPYAVCNNCGAQVRPASSLFCPECGEQLREEENKGARDATNAPVMLSQITANIQTHNITDVSYSVHKKEGSPDSMRVDYWEGISMVASEWVCLLHPGFTGDKARQWFYRWMNEDILDCQYYGSQLIRHAVDCCKDRAERPAKAVVNHSGRFPVIIKLIKEEHAPA